MRVVSTGQVGDGVYLPAGHFLLEAKVKGGNKRVPRSYVRAEHLPDPLVVVRLFTLVLVRGLVGWSVRRRFPATGHGTAP
jgi:hypothetical protein